VNLRAFAAALVLPAVALTGVVPAARAIPPPEAPRSSPTLTPAPASAVGAVLPAGSTLYFVLDDKIDSGSTKPGTAIRLHLRDPLVVNGVTLAPAGSPGSLEIVTTSRAQSGDIDGAVQIHVDPFALPGRNETLPIRAFHEYIDVERTRGQLATRNTTDTIADIFVPGHVLYHAFRRGRQLVLPVGSVLRTETEATIDLTNPATLVLRTPAPFVSTYDPPHADLTPAPFYTPAPVRPRPLPKGKPTLPPTPPPTPTPTAAPPSAAPASAAPAAAATP
jgi:hypothetical protein